MPLIKTQAGGNTWQHMCSLESPEFKDVLLIARAKKGTKHTPEEHTMISRALKHELVLSHTSKHAILSYALQGCIQSPSLPWLLAGCP